MFNFQPMKYLYLLVLSLLLNFYSSFAQWPATGTYYVGTPGAYFNSLQEVADSIDYAHDYSLGIGQWHFILKDTVHHVDTLLKAGYNSLITYDITFSSVGGNSSNCSMQAEYIYGSVSSLKFKNLTLTYNSPSSYFMSIDPSGTSSLFTLDSCKYFAPNVIGPLFKYSGSDMGIYFNVLHSNVKGGECVMAGTGDIMLTFDHSYFYDQNIGFLNISDNYASDDYNVQIRDCVFESDNFNLSHTPFIIKWGFKFSNLKFERNRIKINAAKDFLYTHYSTWGIPGSVSNNYIKIDSVPTGFIAFKLNHDNYVSGLDTLFIQNNTIIANHMGGAAKTISSPFSYPPNSLRLFFSNNLFYGNNCWSADTNIVGVPMMNIDRNVYYPSMVNLPFAQSLGHDSTSIVANPYFLSNSLTPQNSLLDGTGKPLIPNNSTDVLGNSHDTPPDIGCVRFQGNLPPVLGMIQDDTIQLNCFYEDSVAIQLSNSTSSGLSGWIKVLTGNTTLASTYVADTGASGINTSLIIDLSTIPDTGTTTLILTDSSGVFHNGTVHHSYLFLKRTSSYTNQIIPCAGTAFNLELPSTCYVTWSDDSIGQIRRFEPNDSIPFFTVNGLGYCGRDTVQYIVNFTTPAHLIADSISNCQGDSTALIPNGSWETYNWSTASTDNSIIVNNSGVYSFTVTDSVGCEVTDSTKVYTLAPYLNVWNDSTICLYDSVLIDVTNMVDSAWWADSTTVLSKWIYPGQSIALTYTDTNQCVFQHQYQVNSHAVISPYNWKDSTICAFDSLLVDYSVFITNVSWNNGSSSNQYWLQSGDSLSATYTDIYGCSFTDSFFIKGHLVPELNPQSIDLCRGATETVSITGALSQLWSNGDTSSSIPINNDSTLSIVITGEGNCMFYDTLQVEYINIPIPSWPADTNVCQSMTLVAGNNDYTYLWNTGQASNTLLVDSSFNYKVIISDSSGCSDSTNISVTVEDSIVASFTYTINAFLLSMQLTSNNLNAASWLWEADNNVIGNTQTVFYTAPITPINNPVVTIKHTVTNSCNISSEVKVINLIDNVEDVSKPKIKIYPNPANKMLTIEGIDLTIDIVIFNELSQIVKEVKITHPFQQIDVSGFSNGVYFIYEKGNNGAVFKVAKFMVSAK